MTLQREQTDCAVLRARCEQLEQSMTVSHILTWEGRGVTSGTLGEGGREGRRGWCEREELAA